MTEYDWPTIRASTIYAFGGDAPRAELEQRIIDVFTQQPQLVVKTIGIVTTGYESGKVHSPWAILDLNLKEAVRPGVDLTVTDTTEKQKRITRAEQWIKAAGIHYDRESEVLLELFGSQASQLRPYAQIDLVPDDRAGVKWQLSEPRGDTALVQRMAVLWHQHRPTGEAIETDELERAQHWKEHQHELDELRAKIAAARKPPPQPGTIGTYLKEPLPEPEPADDDIPF